MSMKLGTASTQDTPKTRNLKLHIIHRPSEPLGQESYPESNTPISVDNISGLTQHEQNVRSNCLHNVTKCKEEDMNEWHRCQGIQKLAR
jgi:hypothetical protein